MDPWICLVVGSLKSLGGRQLTVDTWRYIYYHRTCTLRLSPTALNVTTILHSYNSYINIYYTRVKWYCVPKRNGVSPASSSSSPLATDKTRWRESVVSALVVFSFLFFTRVQFALQNRVRLRYYRRRRLYHHHYYYYRCCCFCYYYYSREPRADKTRLISSWVIDTRVAHCS